MAIADPTLDYVPLFPDATEAAILGRCVDSANEGLDPVADASAWVDTREGGHWRTPIMPCIRELARLYDLASSEVPMSGSVLWAWGTYLDDLASVWNVFRLPATPSRGIVRFSGAAGLVIGSGVQVGVAPSTPDAPAPLYQVDTGGTIPGGGTLDLAVTATEAGAVGNVAANAITAPSTPLPGVTFTNPAATVNGTDPENDEGLRTRLLVAIAGKGPGTVADYVRWTQNWPGIGKVTVIPVWNGPTTVLVVAMDKAGQPLTPAALTDLQNDLDPVAGTGAGTAPVGATVTVKTGTLLPVNVAAHPTFEPGFSWDGFAGTVALGPDITAALAAYIQNCSPGGQVVVAHIIGIFSTWTGVHDVSGVTLNAGTANINVASAPTPQAPQLGTLTIT